MLVSIYAKVPIKPVQNLSVQRLDVSFIRQDPDWIEKFDQLLSLLPSLKQLLLDICLLHIDFNKFSRILKQRLIDLSSFKCEIHANIFPIKLNNNIQRYHPLFKNIYLKDINDNECQCNGLKLCINGKKKK